MASSLEQQNLLLLLNCDYKQCNCSFFIAKISSSRDCSSCGHSWFYHAIDKIKKADSNEIRLEIVFNIASLVLYATSAIPISLKILLDRLLSKLLHSEVLQIIYALGWLYEDYVRGYKFFNNSLVQLDSWKTVSSQEELDIIRLFSTFSETKSIAERILEQLKSESGKALPIQPSQPDNVIIKCKRRSQQLFSAAAKQTFSSPSQSKPNCSNSNVARNLRLKSYRCYQCQKVFRSLNSIKMHRQKNHSSLPPASLNPDETSPPYLDKENGSLDSSDVFTPVEPLSPHKKSCRCKKCKYLASKTVENGSASIDLTVTCKTSNIYEPLSLICDEEKLRTFEMDQYLVSHKETDALQELKSLEALVCSVDMDSELSIKTGSPFESNSVQFSREEKFEDCSFNLSESDDEDFSIVVSEDEQKLMFNDKASVNSSNFDTSLSWSELKNSSLNVREKLDSLLNNQEKSLSRRRRENTFKGNDINVSSGSIRSLMSCKCPKCSKVFSSPASMRVHFKNVHIREMHKCLVPGCNSLFNSVRSRNRHSMNSNLHQRKSAHIHFL